MPPSMNNCRPTVIRVLPLVTTSGASAPPHSNSIRYIYAAAEDDVNTVEAITAHYRSRGHVVYHDSCNSIDEYFQIYGNVNLSTLTSVYRSIVAVHNDQDGLERPDDGDNSPPIPVQQIAGAYEVEEKIKYGINKNIINSSPVVPSELVNNSEGSFGSSTTIPTTTTTTTTIVTETMSVPSPSSVPRDSEFEEFMRSMLSPSTTVVTPSHPTPRGGRAAQYLPSPSTNSLNTRLTDQAVVTNNGGNAYRARLTNRGNSSASIIDAVLVEDPKVYDAYLVPWYMQPRKCALVGGGLIALVFAIIIGVVVAVMKPEPPVPPPSPIPSPWNQKDDSTTTTTTTTTSTAATNSIIITTAKPSQEFCFTSREELRNAIDEYIIGGGCLTDSNCVAGKQYGWPMNTWCVSAIRDMSELFKDLEDFNEDISEWDVRSVTTMKSMFYNANAFNGDLSKWDVSSVVDMSYMFYGTDSFNRDLSNWDVSSVTDMSYMFYGANIFNGDVSTWDVSSVTDMRNMFSQARDFNSDLSRWVVSSVTDMSNMFLEAHSFNSDLSSWVVSSVTNMNFMFSSTKSFNRDLSSWDVSSVTDMSFMFDSASSFNGDVSSWDVSSVIKMRFMFNDAVAFDGNVSSWDVSSVTDMSYMFDGASSFNGDMSSWDISSVEFIVCMLRNAAVFNQNLCAWANNFPYDEATNIFSGSGCTYVEEPQEDQQGPFCASSC